MWRALHRKLIGGKRAPWAMAVLLGGALTSAGCQDGYPIATTHCDRFCDVTQKTQCTGYSPAGCVAGCEQKVWGGVACDAALDAWLTCIASHPAEIACGSPFSPPVSACVDQQIALVSCVREQTGQDPDSAE